MPVPVISDDTALEVAEVFARKLFASTLICPTDEEAVTLLRDVAEMPEPDAALYIARYLWSDFDGRPGCSRSAIPCAVRKAFRAAEETAQRLRDEAEERAAAQDREDRLAAGERRLAEARALVAAAAA